MNTFLPSGIMTSNLVVSNNQSQNQKFHDLATSKFDTVILNADPKQINGLDFSSKLFLKRSTTLFRTTGKIIFLVYQSRTKSLDTTSALISDRNFILKRQHQFSSSIGVQIILRYTYAHHKSTNFDQKSASPLESVNFLAHQNRR